MWLFTEVNNRRTRPMWLTMHEYVRHAILLVYTPACLSMEEREPPDPGCVNNLSCIIRLCLSSSSRLRLWASAARSAGSTAIMLSSISARTDWRSEEGNVAKKLAGSTGASGLAVGLVCAASRSCSILCWAKTWQYKHTVLLVLHHYL